jgi:hypothetical protein
MEFENSRIERLKRSLYSRDESKVPQEKRTPVHGVENSVPQNWGEEPSFAYAPEIMKRKNNSFFNKFFAFSLLFFVIAAGIATFIFFGGMNLISSNNIDVKVTGPSSISSGEELDLGISVVNQNRTDLENVTLFIDYPEGTTRIDGDKSDLVHDKIALGTINKGQSKDYALRALMFGEKDSIKNITMRVEYTVKGSNAVFSKEKNYEMTINSSPLLLDIDYPKEINSGQLVTLGVNITSNSTVVVPGALVKVEFPYGFTYKDSTLKPVRDGLWSIGDLKNGDKKSFKITGQLVGQNMEDRSFQVSVGTPSTDQNKDLDTTFASSQVTVGIRRSFFNLSTEAEGDPVLGQTSNITILWQNTLPEKLVNNRVKVTLSGNVYDRTRVLPNNGGYYRSSDNAILWDKNTTDNLNEMVPGAEGRISFAVGSVSGVKSLKNPYIDIHVSMSGDRSGADQSTVSSTQDITVKFSSQIGIYARSYRAVGPISNTGPIPPRAEKESTYAIAWGITNTTNDVKDAIVTATLPAYVTWKGEYYPQNESVSYDPDTRKITWNAGSVSSGVGFAFAPRTVTFKVGVTPSVTNVGNILEILSATSVSATDTFTSKKLISGASPANTRFSDPSFKTGDDTVVK